MSKQADVALTLDKFRVCIVAPYYLPICMDEGNDGYKGSERVIEYMVNELVRRGAYVYLIAPEGSIKPGKGELLTTGEPLWDPMDPSKREVKDEKRISARERTRDQIKAVARKDLKPHIIDCHFAEDDFEVMRTIDATGIFWCITYHGPIVTRIEDGLEAPLAVRVAKAFPHVNFILVGKNQLEAYERLKIDTSLMHVVPNGIPDLSKNKLDRLRALNREDTSKQSKDTSERSKDTPERNTLVMLCRLSVKKDIPKALDLIQELSGWKIVVGGTKLNDQNDVQYWKEILSPLFKKYSDRITLQEDVNERNKNEFLSKYGPLLAFTKRTDDEWGPPFWEPDGLHITEKLRLGQVALCDEGIHYEKIPEPLRSKYHFTQKDPKEVVKAMAKLLNDEKSVAEMNSDTTYALCRDYFKEVYDVKKTVERRFKKYMKIINKDNIGKAAEKAADKTVEA
ncbi:hypothetical protein F5Y15DRAFT_151501 [Xylariaceae sp. FL0016]|nr:hypothetical protein F5Y15DRAFT_151501 [Xylariaceae sp. FL0016]